MIGVLAIMAVLASVVAPNVFRSVERAAIRAEEETLKALGGQAKLLARETGAPPTGNGWAAELAAYSDLSANDVGKNRRGLSRVLILDRATNPSERLMILSSMRGGLTLPSNASVNTALRFQEIWDTPDGSVPPATSWSGWSNWSAVANSGDSLVIERVNLAPVFRQDLRPFTITLNNQSGAAASYVIVSASGVSGSAVNVGAGASVVLSGLRARQRVNLYRAAGGSVLDYSYVISDSGKTFDFDGAGWTPQ